MKYILPSGGRSFIIQVKIETRSPQNIRFVASDASKRNTEYVNRKGKVDKTRTFDLKFPVSPETMRLRIYNVANKDKKNDPSFKVVSIILKELVHYNIWMDKQDQDFLKFALFFSEKAGMLSASQNIQGKLKPSVYVSDCGNFQINYHNVIKDKKSGKVLSTPARIGNTTGRIEISRKKFLGYTIPMRLIILLHEYSHKWKNPQMGRKIQDESAADVNGLYIYLGKGFSEIEAHQAFLYVFKDANTKSNHKRYKILNDFIKKFNKGEIAKKKVG